MNGGSSVFLIFLLIVAAFAGLGYLAPEMSRQTEEIKTLQTQTEEINAELDRLKNQNTALSQENDVLRQADEKVQTENQNLRNEIIVLEGEISTLTVDLEEEHTLVNVLQQDLENERAMSSALKTEKEDLEAKLRAADAINEELAETLQDALIVNQMLQEESTTLQQQLNAKKPFQELFFSDTIEMSSLFAMASSEFNWIFFPLVIFAVMVAGGYRLHCKHRKTKMRTSNSHKSVSTERLPLNELRSVTSEIVTIRIPRKQLCKYIKWLRQIS